MILKHNAAENMKSLISSGIDRENLAEIAGITRQQCWRILSGRSFPEIDTCERIASSLDLPLTALMLEPREFSKIFNKKKKFVALS